jgi:glycerophosphoryl diester phosphodiesterase
MDGADGVELDVRATSDGKLVIAHDDELHLTGAQPHRISQLTYGQLLELTPAGADPIPTLRDVLKFQAETGCWMNVELKGDVPAPGFLAHAAAREISIHGGDHLILSSFSPQIVWILARLLPGVPVAWLLDENQTWSKRFLPLGLLGARGVHPQAALLDEVFIRRIRQKNGFIGTWTVNDPAEGKRLAAWGVDVLIGDDPGALLRALS